VVVVVVQKNLEDSLKETAGESSTDIALAFRLGCELFEYMMSVEMIWMSPKVQAEKRVNGFLVRSRKTMAEFLDQLFEYSQVKQESANAFVDEMISFEEYLIREMESENANAIRDEVKTISDFLSCELTPDDFPCPESENLESLVDTLFSDDHAKKLKAQLRALENSARQVVRLDSKLLTFFRLGFDILRPTDPLYLDNIFLVEANCQAGNHEQSVISSRRRLFEDARDVHVELQGVNADQIDGYDLREQISEALKFQYEEFERFGLGLILYPKSKRLSRTGYGHVSLSRNAALWSLLESAAPATKGAVVDLQTLKDGYKERKLKPKIRDGVETERNPLRNATYNLNSHLVKVCLRLQCVGTDYRLVHYDKSDKKKQPPPSL
jgi:hypothetical protein